MISWNNLKHFSLIYWTISTIQDLYLTLTCGPGKEYINLTEEFEGKIWNFKDEALKYCKIDCKALYDILNTFNELIFTHFSINPHSSKILTLPP